MHRPFLQLRFVEVPINTPKQFVLQRLHVLDVAQLQRHLFQHSAADGRADSLRVDVQAGMAATTTATTTTARVIIVVGCRCCGGNLFTISITTTVIVVMMMMVISGRTSIFLCNMVDHFAQGPVCEFGIHRVLHQLL